MRVLVQIHDKRLKHSPYAHVSAKGETEEYLAAEVSVEGDSALIVGALRAAADSVERKFGGV